ncbi:hypothetical protein QTN47_20165 [Danxiaibacter flavus]|uniref:Uncharacterized protein n=1 Tax=Danxiaibacter flavus TaxID=3049108 RepID=A0ABV3ZJ48_9BACT|nr:hypothetical protein QNM32_20175 [Chitinophagaceae bacterium DXS]
MKNSPIFVSLVILLAAALLFIIVYKTRRRNIMTRKRFLAIGIFITLVMNSIFYSYLARGEVKPIPAFAILTLEVFEILLFALVWGIFKLVEKNKKKSLRGIVKSSEREKEKMHY